MMTATTPGRLDHDLRMKLMWTETRLQAALLQLEEARAVLEMIAAARRDDFGTVHPMSCPRLAQEFLEGKGRC